MKPHINCILHYEDKIYWCASQFTKGTIHFSFILIDKKTKNISIIENSTKLTEVRIFECDKLRLILRNEPGAKIGKTWQGVLSHQQGFQILITELNYAVQK
jgi:hypothetical protein